MNASTVLDVEQLLTGAGFERQVSLVEPYVNAMAIRRAIATATAQAESAATASARAAFEKFLTLPMAEILLMAGEMTAGEKRTVRAVLDGLASRLKAT